MKFEQILDAAHELIVSKGYDNFGMSDLVKRAGVAKGSVYHFFPNIEAVFVALVERFDDKFIEIVDQPIEAKDVETWTDVIRIHFDRSQSFINDTPPALMLIIGPGRTWQTRLKDASGDAKIAEHMLKSLSRFFVVPASPPPARLLQFCIQILNGLWELSVVEYGYVHEEHAAETKRAVCAYLAEYWPGHLERRKPQDVGGGR